MCTENIITEESYEYSGPIAKCDDDYSGGAWGVGGEGGTLMGNIFDPLNLSNWKPKPEAPDFSSTDVGDLGSGWHESSAKALTRYKLALQGLSYSRGRIFPATDATLTAILGKETADRVKLGQKIDAQVSERLLAALRGEISDPAFEESAKEQRETTRVEVARGAGEESTIGSRKLSDVERNIDISRSQIARGEISAFSGIDAVRQGQQDSVTNYLLGQLNQSGQFNRGLAQDYALRETQRRQDFDLSIYLGELGREAGQQQSRSSLFGSVLGAAAGAA